MDPRHPFFKIYTKASEVYLASATTETSLSASCNQSDHSPDRSRKEGPLFRRSAAFGEISFY